VAGLLTGVVGLFLPMALGGSHELAEMAFHGELPLLLLLGALATKFGLTVLAYGSGAPGGIFAPTLVIGSCLGAGVGTLSAALVGSGHGAIAGFAFVGMGALFTAVARAPITAILIVFELTGHYDHILPLMLACVVAHLVAHSLGSTSIYDALLVRDGIHLPEPGAADGMTAVAVAAVMTAPVETIAPDESLAAVRERFRHATHHGFPVSDAGQPLGMITGADLMRATVQGLPDDTPALALASRPVITVLTTDSLRAAVRRITAAEIGRLVVVVPGLQPTIVGIVTRSDLLAGVDRGEAQSGSPARANGGADRSRQAAENSPPASP
jgi:CIC family chloride channel protein